MHSVNSLLLNYRAGCPFAKVHWLAWAAWANPPIRFPLHLCWARLAWVCTTSQPSNFCIIFCTCRLAAECNAGAAVIRRCAVRPEYTVLASHHKLNTHSHTWRCSRPWKKKDWSFFPKTLSKLPNEYFTIQFLQSNTWNQKCYQLRIGFVLSEV